MTQQKIQETVQECFRKSFPHRAVPGGSESFQALGINSLETAYFMFHLERAFNLDLAELRLHEADSLSAYIGKIAASMGK